MKPFLKWVGGKTQCLETVISHFPKTIVNYYEPFVGGGSVLLHVLTNNLVSGTVYASDVNEGLINTYAQVQENPNELVDEIERIGVPDKVTYYTLRTEFNSEPKDTLRSAALFIVLNKTCFRGVYREGPNGFNVPYGHYKNPTIVSREHILQVSRLIQRVQFTCESFEYVLPRAIPGDLVYMDPPYFPVTETSFVTYTTKEFSGEKLVTQCKSLTCSWIMSNSDVDVLKREFDCWIIIPCRRAIHSKDPSSSANELLIKCLIPTNTMDE